MTKIECRLVLKFQDPTAQVRVHLPAVPRAGELVRIAEGETVRKRYLVKGVAYQGNDITFTADKDAVGVVVLLVEELAPDDA